MQAGLAGYGWNLCGLSYIDRGESSPGQEFFTLVLNGSRFDIRGGKSAPRLDPISFATIAYQTDNALISRWVVTTTDGLVYTFGGARRLSSWPTPTAYRSDQQVLSVIGTTAGGESVRHESR